MNFLKSNSIVRKLLFCLSLLCEFIQLILIKLIGNQYFASFSFVFYFLLSKELNEK